MKTKKKYLFIILNQKLLLNQKCRSIIIKIIVKLAIIHHRFLMTLQIIKEIVILVNLQLIIIAALVISNRVKMKTNLYKLQINKM